MLWLYSIILHHITSVNVGIDAFKRDICKNGGVSSLISAVERFMDDDTTRKNGLRALMLLVTISPSSIADGAPVILKAIDAYLEDDDTQQIVCTTLRLLVTTEIGSATKNHAAILCHAGAIPILVASLKRSCEVTTITSR